MRDLVSLLMILAGCVICFYAGMYAGRAGERRAVESGKVDLRRNKPIQEWESELRRARGVRPLHRSPETATRIRQAVIKR